MTQDEIIELARQAGMEQDVDMWFSPSYEQCDVHIIELERFAKLVAEKEREACAMVCDEVGTVEQWDKLSEAADRIRARGNT